MKQQKQRQISSIAKKVMLDNQLWCKIPKTLQVDISGGGYTFPCDGPGRGGTCAISAWDA